MNISTTTDLFSPIQMGPYTLRKRMVMAPKTDIRASECDLPDQASLYGGDEHGDTDYPLMET